MVGVQIGLRALVLRGLRALILRGLEASTGKVTEAFPVSCGLRRVRGVLEASVCGRCPDWSPSIGSSQPPEIGSSRPGGEHGQADRGVSGELRPSESMKRSEI